MFNRTETYSYPFHVMAQNGPGYSQSTLTQLNQLLPMHAVGRLPIHLVANLATGNLVIQDKLHSIQSQAAPIKLGYTYNSKAPQPWHLSAISRVQQAPNRLLCLNLYETDGSVADYEFDPASKYYFGPAEADGRPVIRVVEQDGKKQYIWDHPKTRETIFFNDQGLAMRRTDANGLNVDFKYDEQAQLKQIIFSADYYFQIDKEIKDNEIITTLNRHDKDQVTCWHQYTTDKNGLLIKSTPATGDSVQYFYNKEKPTFINRIQQSDGTEINFTYSDDKLSAITQGKEDAKNKYNFTYQAKLTTLTDAKDKRIQFKMNEKQLITEIVKNDETIIVDYTANGQIQSLHYPDSSVESFEYENGSGLIKKHVNRNGLITEFEYNNNLLIAKRVIDPQNLSTAHITHYVYDESNPGRALLRFTISPCGRVTEYTHENGLLKSERNYLQNYYINDVFTLDSLQQWSAIVTKEKPQTSLTTYDYDANGRIKETRQYAKINDKARGVPNSVAIERKEWNVYDQCERQEQLINTDKQAFSLRYTNFDSNELPLMDRIAVGTPNTVNTQYQYKPNETKIIEDVSSTTLSYDADGLLQTKTLNGANVNETTRFKRDVNGEVLAISFCDKDQAYLLSDENHRIRFKVSAGGSVTEYRYDAKNRSNTTIAYAQQIDVATLKNNTSNINSLDAQLVKLKDDKNNRISYVVEDANQKPRFTMDASGRCIENRYDCRGNLLMKIAYAEVLTADEFNKLLTKQPLARKFDTLKDRIHRFAYDADNNCITEQDAAGFITHHEYDAANRNVASTRYAMPIADFNTGLERLQIISNNQQDSITYKVFDAANRCIAEVDAEGYLTAHEYYPHGKVQKTTRYANKIDSTWFSADRQSIPAVTASSEDATEKFAYNERLELVESRGPHGKLTTYQYDNRGHEIAKSIQAEDFNSSHEIHPTDYIRSCYKEYDATGRVLLEVNALVAEQIRIINADAKISADEKQKQIAALKQTQGIRHEYLEGLKISTTQGIGSTTYYYYDTDRRLVACIDPTGAVIQFKHKTAFKQVDEKCAYANRLNAAQMLKIRGGWWNDELANLFISIADPNQDQIEKWEYNEHDQITQHIDAELALTTFAYNNFGECNKEQHPVNSTEPSLTISREFDNRGNVIELKKSAGDQTIITRSAFNHFTNNITDSWNESGDYQHIVRDRLGRKVLIERLKQDASVESGKYPDEADIEIAEMIQYDAFNRPLIETDANSQATQYEYRGLETVVTLPSKNSSTLTHNIFNEVITKKMGENCEQFAHAAHGEIERHIDVNGATHVTCFNFKGEKDKEIEENDTVHIFARNEAGQLKELTTLTKDGKQKHESYEPNAFGYNETVVNARGVTIENKFDRKNRLTKTVKAATNLGLVTEYRYNAQDQITYKAEGTLKTLQQYETEMQYDDFGRLQYEITDPKQLKLTQTQAHDAIGNIVNHIDAAGFQTQSIFNKRNEKCFELVDMNATETSVTAFTYTPSGKVSSIRIYDELLPVGELHKEMSISDITAKCKTSPTDGLTKFYYNKNDREQFTVVFTEDDAGQLIGIVTEKMYDDAGRIKTLYEFASYLPSTINPLNTTSLEQWADTAKQPKKDRFTGYFYEGKNERFSINQAGHVVEKRYDSANNKIAEIAYAISLSPEKLLALTDTQKLSDHFKACGINPNDRAEFWLYDGFRNMTHNVAASGHVTMSQFDENNNIVSTCEFKQPFSVIIEDDLRAQKLLALKPSDQDSITNNQYDTADRLERTTHPSGAVENFKRGAAGELTALIDANNKQTDFTYDGAKRLVETLNPEITITDVKPTPEGKLSGTETKERIKDITQYDGNGHPAAVIKAAGRSDARTLIFTCNKQGQTIQTTIEKVKVDDNTLKGNIAKRPDKEVTISTTTRYNSKGKKIVDINEAGVATFYVYDAAERLRFVVKNEASITEYRYKEAHGKATYECSYANPVDGDAITEAMKQNGMSLAWIRAHTHADPAQDRVKEMEYDQQGNLQSIKRSTRFFYYPTKDANVLSGQAQPTTKFAYNNFGECIEKDVLLAPDVWAKQLQWHDELGRLVAEVNSEKYLTVYSYDGASERIATLDEYANALAVEDLTLISQSSPADLMKLVTINPDKDRHEENSYDKHGNLISETKKNVVVQSLKIVDRLPVMENADHDSNNNKVRTNLKKTYTYNYYNKRTSTTHENGATEYWYYNDRQDLIAHAEVPRETKDDKGNVITITPLSIFHIDAFGQTVGTKQSNKGGTLAELTQLPNLIADQGAKIKVTYKLMDNRGLVIEQQNAAGEMLHLTYANTRHIARSMQQVSEIGFDAKFNTTSHLHEKFYTRDKANRVTSLYLRKDDKVEEANHVSYNSFGETEFERVNDADWHIKRHFDTCGNIWLSNLDKGVKTAEYFDLSGNKTLQIQSESEDLFQKKYSDLETLLETDPLKYPRLEITRDTLGRSIQHKKPLWWNKRNEKLPSSIFAYDRWNNMLKQQDANGNATLMSYNFRNEIVSVLQPRTDVVDKHGVKTEINPLTLHGYDTMGHEIASIDANQHTTGHVYNNGGQNIQTIFANGLSEETRYDAFGDAICFLDVDQHAWLSSFNMKHEPAINTLPTGQTSVVTTNEAGNRSTFKDTDGIFSCYVTDLRGNVSDRYLGLGSRYHFEYDSNHLTTEEVLPSGSKLINLRDPFGNILQHKNLSNNWTKTEYNHLNLPTRTYLLDQNSQWQTMQVNSVVNYFNKDKAFPYVSEFKVTYPLADKQDISYEYQHGLLTKTIDAGLKTVSEFGYDNEGQRSSVLLYRSGVKFHEMSTTRDSLGRESVIIHNNKTPSETFGYAKFTYSYDAVGNRRHLNAQLKQPGYSEGCNLPLLQHDFWYDYDAINRVVINGGVLVDDMIGVDVGQGLAITYKGGQRLHESSISAKNIYYKEKFQFNENGFLIESKSNTGLVSSRNYEFGLWPTSTKSVYGKKWRSNKVNFDANHWAGTDESYAANGTHTGTYYLKDLDGFVTNQGSTHHDIKGKQTDDLYKFIPIGFDSWEVRQVVTTHFEPKFKVDGHSTVLYDSNGNFTGKWNTSDEAKFSVYNETSTEGWIMNKQRILTRWVDYLNFDASFNYIRNIHGATLGEYTSQYWAAIVGADRKWHNVQEAHSKKHGTEGEPKILLSNFVVRQTVEALGSHGRTEAEFANDHLNDVNNPSGWDMAYRASIGPQHYLVMPGDTLASIAEKFNMGPTGARVLAFVNCLMTGQKLKTNWRLTIPPYDITQNKADVYNLESAVSNAIMGSFLPHLDEYKPKKKKTEWWKIVVVVIIAVVAAYYLPMLAKEFLALANASASSMLASAIAYGAAGALEDVALQCVNIAMGMQSGINLGEVASAGITSGLGGALQASTAFDKLSTMEKIMRAGQLAITAQLTEMAVGNQKSFDVKALGIALVTAAAGNQLDEKLTGTFGNPIAEQATSSAVTSAMSATLGSALYHTPLNENTVANVLGTSIGTAVGAKFVAWRNQQDQLETAYKTKQGPATSRQSKQQQGKTRPLSAAEKRFMQETQDVINIKLDDFQQLDFSDHYYNHDVIDAKQSLAENKPITPDAKLNTTHKEIGKHQGIYNSQHLPTYSKAKSAAPMSADDARATRAARWANDLSHKDWGKAIADLPYAARFALHISSYSEDMIAGYNLVTGGIETLYNAGKSIYGVGGEIIKALPHLSNLKMVGSFNEYWANMVHTNNDAIQSLLSTATEIGHTLQTALNAKDPAIAGYAAGQLGGQAIIAYAVPKGMSVAGNAIKNVGFRTLGMFGKTATVGGEDVAKVAGSLGANPFKGKSFEEIDKILTARGYKKMGPNPAEGKGSYFHPKTGRKYYLDKGGVYKEGTELPHVDVHRMDNGINLEKVGKRRYPIGENLIEENINTRGYNANF